MQVQTIDASGLELRETLPLQIIRTTFRRIPASHIDAPKIIVRQGQAREHRFNAVFDEFGDAPGIEVFHLPPLRERIQDIAPLVRGMAARFTTKFRKDLFSISSPAMAALETFHWPGNIRQLENAVQQAVLVSNGSELLLEHLPQPIREYLPSVPEAGPSQGESLFHNREVVERNVIQRALANNGNTKGVTTQWFSRTRIS